MTDPNHVKSSIVTTILDIASQTTHPSIIVRYNVQHHLQRPRGSRRRVRVSVAHQTITNGRVCYKGASNLRLPLLLHKPKHQLVFSLARSRQTRTMPKMWPMTLKALASSVLATAQVRHLSYFFPICWTCRYGSQLYLPTSIGSGQPQTLSSTGSTTSSDVTSSIQAGTAATLDTTKEYLASAHQTGMAAAQPHLDRVKGGAQEFLGQGTQGSTSTSSTRIPATGAPFQSGKKSVDTSYSGLKAGKNETRPTSL